MKTLDGRQQFVIAAVTLLTVFLVVGAKKDNSAEPAMYDLVIANGRVMDPESGLDAVRNVGIRAGKIAAISAEALKGKQTIEARGLVVALGFIDIS